MELPSNSNTKNPSQKIQFRYIHNEADLQRYISKEVRSSRRGKVIVVISLLYLLLSCLTEIGLTIVLNLYPSFEKIYDVGSLGIIPWFLCLQSGALFVLVLAIIPTRLTTRLFHDLTWDGPEMLITIDKEGWSLETEHRLTEIRFSGLAIKTKETEEAIIIYIENGPSLFLAKKQLLAETLDELYKLISTLTAAEKV